MVSDIRRLAAAASVLFLGLVPAAGAAQTADLADLCAENGAGPVTENTLILRTAEAIPSSCTIDLVDASLRIVGAEIATTALAIFRTGSGTVEITNSTIEAEGAFSITDGAGRVRITDSSLSGSNNSDIDVSGDIHTTTARFRWRREHQPPS